MVRLGCDYYDSLASIEINEKAGRPRIGIGSNSRIENARKVSVLSVLTFDTTSVEGED